MNELDDVRKVRLTKKLMDEMASRDLSGNRVIWSWGEPDGEGFYSPSATLDLSDNLAEVAAQQERERLRTAFATYWDWLITQRAYGNGGGWGEAAMLKVSTLLAEPSDG